MKRSELDPKFVRAWGELFINYVHGRWNDAQARSQERLIAKKLEELDAASAEAHYAKAWIAHGNFESAEAEREFERSIRASRRSPYAHSCTLLI